MKPYKIAQQADTRGRYEVTLRKTGLRLGYVYKRLGYVYKMYGDWWFYSPIEGLCEEPYRLRSDAAKMVWIMMTNPDGGLRE